MSEVVYLMLGRDGDRFNILYVDSTDGTQEADFFTKNARFKCWHQHAGYERNLYLAILPISDPNQNRNRIVSQIASKYDPVCNRGD